MKFHVTIKNNETGEMLVDMDANAIQGAISDDEKTAGILYTDCSSNDLCNNIEVVRHVLDKTLEEHPELLMLLMMKDIVDKKIQGGGLLIG